MNSYFHPQNKQNGYFELNYLRFCKDRNLIDLIQRMLKMDYNERISAEDALKHPFFKAEIT